MTLVYKWRVSDAPCPHCECRSKECLPEVCAACEGTGFHQLSADVLTQNELLVKGLSRLAIEVHRDNVQAGWWTNIETGENLLMTRDRLSMLMLCVTELSEAEEADWQGSMDDKLPRRLGLHVELADTCIRLLDLIGAEHIRYGGGIVTHYAADIPTPSVSTCFQDYLTNGSLYTQGDLMLIVRDLSKAAEAYRKNAHGKARVWLTTALFRCIAYAAWNDIPLFEIIEEKRAFNRSRADHKIENRRRDGGKKA